MTAIRTMLKYSWLALVVAALPASAGTSRIYITNSAGDAINVIDPETNTVVQNIKGIEAAHGINFSPDGTRVYVSNESDSTLDVFDQKSGSLLKKIKLSNHPNNITVAKDGRVFVGIAREPGASRRHRSDEPDGGQDHPDARPPAQHLYDPRPEICDLRLGGEEVRVRGRCQDL